MASGQREMKKPPSFRMPPKSALFSKLESFLPLMATENKKLEEAVAAGQGDKHNIEVVDEVDEESSVHDAHEEGDDVMMNPDDDGTETQASASESATVKPPVIEMNFALGLMDEGGSDSGSDSEEEANPTEIDLAASISAARLQDNGDTAASENISLRLASKETASSRPMIVELN